MRAQKAACNRGSRRTPEIAVPTDRSSASAPPAATALLPERRTNDGGFPSGNGTSCHSPPAPKANGIAQFILPHRCLATKAIFGGCANIFPSSEETFRLDLNHLTRAYSRYEIAVYLRRDDTFLLRALRCG